MVCRLGFGGLLLCGSSSLGLGFGFGVRGLRFLGGGGGEVKVEWLCVGFGLGSGG